jgi:hypothetical protein
LLVPSSNAPARGPQPASAPPKPNLNQARDTLASTVASRRAQRTALWQDSTVFQDSFFAPDSRDGFGVSEFTPVPPSKASRSAPQRVPDFAASGPETVPNELNPVEGEAVGGIVVDAFKASNDARR